MSLGVDTGTDTNVATELIGGIHYALAKLIDSTAGSTTPTGTAANPLPVAQTGALPAGTNAIGKLAANSGIDIGDVDVTSIAAGENHLGKFGGETVVVTPTVTVSASPDYSSGDSIGGKITLTNAVRVSGGTGVLQSIVITDKANQSPEGTILIFDADPSAATITDNAAFVFSTDVTKVIASVPVVTADYATINSTSVATLSNLGRVVKAASGTSLYAAFVTTTAANLASTSDIGLRFTILQD